MFQYTNNRRMSDLELFRSSPLFSRMAKTVCEALLADAEIMSVPAGGTIFWKEERADRIYLVLDGRVKIYNITADGNETVVTLVAPGHTFGELDIFASARQPSTARHSLYADAIRRTRLMVIPSSSLLQCMEENPEVSFSIAEALSERTRTLLHQTQTLELQSMPHRVAKFLLQLSLDHTGPAVITLPFEKYLIAKRLGMSPETFSRALLTLQGVGVKSSRANIYVSDLERLRAYCEIDRCVE